LTGLVDLAEHSCVCVSLPELRVNDALVSLTFLEALMKKVLMKSCLVAVLVVCFTAAAWGDKKFEIEFKKLYYKPDSDDPKEKAFVAAVDKVSTKIEGEEGVIKNACNVCHVKGKAKKMRNEYGQKLSELLDVKTDKTNMEKIKASITKVGEMKSPKGPTYAELIKAGRLPAD
jgi:hypothetical protein